jgi:hypothetical protein
MNFVAESSARRWLRCGCASPRGVFQQRSRRLGGSSRRLIVASPAALRQAASPLRRFSIIFVRVGMRHFDESRLEIIGPAASIEA